MSTEAGPGAPRLIVVSWLAAAAAFPSTLVLAAAGQGLGAALGGCAWIGLSLPLERQVWALVNQPVLNFASLPRAFGYWWGSWLLPLVAAVVLMALRPRSRTWTVELMVLQAAWAAAVVAGAWLPLLDADDGHLVRWLALQRLPAAAVWAAPLAAAAVALAPAVRLLELARRRTPNLGRLRRAALVAVHLVLPATTWAALATLLGGETRGRGLAAVAVPVAAVLVLAWFRYPAPSVCRMQPPTLRGAAVLVVTIVLAVAALWVGGRPLADGRAAGVLWGEPSDFNNIRSWIAPRALVGRN
ncbi:MAG TPA: hypothetical protein VLT81_18550 [Chondromyces sp.]|nr:hypothetical protein [Chondromyces sp.]